MAYTVTDLQASIQDDLKDSSFSTTRILRYLNAAQRFIFNTHSFPFSEASYSGSVTAGATTITQQANWQATIAFALTSLSNTDLHYGFNRSNYLEHRDFFERYPIPANNDAGMPTYWTDFGNVIYFSCPLNANYTFTQHYYKSPTVLTAGVDVPTVPEAFRELVELYALYRAEKYRGNHDVAGTYKAEFEEILEQMTLRTTGATEMGFFQMPSSHTRQDYA